MGRRKGKSMDTVKNGFEVEVVLLKSCLQVRRMQDHKPFVVAADYKKWVELLLTLQLDIANQVFFSGL